MSELLSLKKTPMQAIYEKTSLDIIREISRDLAKNIEKGESYTSYNGIDNAVQEFIFTKETKEKMDKYHTIEDPDYSWMGQDVYKNFTNYMDISKVGNFNMSLDQCFELIRELVLELEDTVYGALVMTADGKQFNIFHPIIMSELLNKDSSISKVENIYTMAVYTWKDISQLKDRYAKKLFVGNNNFQMEIAELILSIDSPTEYITQNSKFNVDIVNDRFVLNYVEEKKHRITGKDVTEETASGRNFIIPFQILNVKGVAFPYYGAAYSKNGLAWNLTPMRSANIASPSSSSGKKYDYGSRICTHSGNSKTQKGISALNHSNTVSPLTKYILRRGSLTYAYTCLISSIGLVDEDFEITGSKKEDKALTFQEFLSENKDSSKKDYLKYVRERLKSKMTKIKKIKTTEDIPIFESGNAYPKGIIVQHEGKKYESNIHDAIVTPGRENSTVWIYRGLVDATIDETEDEPEVETEVENLTNNTIVQTEGEPT